MSVLRYSARVHPCATLGPGNRAALWVHGCCFSCPGCIGENYRTGKFRETPPEEMADWYLSQRSDGLTISGGEPTLQAEALAETIRRIREKRDCGVIVYTGFVYEDLLKKNERSVRDFLGEIDLLIDGPYIREQDFNQPYRGSANQRLLPLTDRYRRELETYYAAAQSRRIEIRMDEERTLMAGVPSREQALIWRNIKTLGDETNDERRY